MFLEPIISINSDEMHDVGAGNQEIQNDGISVDTSSVDGSGHRVYKVTQTYPQITFNAKHGTYNFNIKTECHTYVGGYVQIRPYVQCSEVSRKDNKNSTITVSAVFGGDEKLIYSFSRNSPNVGWKYTVWSKQPSAGFYGACISRNEWVNRINSGMYKIYGSNFSGMSGYISYNGEWYHIAYLGDDAIRNTLKLRFVETYNGDNSTYEYEFDSVPFSDSPFTSGLPVLNLSVTDKSETSVTYTLDTNYMFTGTVSGKISILTKDVNSLRVVADDGFQGIQLPYSNTINDLSLSAGVTYYIGGGVSDSSGDVTYDYDLTHTIDGKISNKVNRAWICPKIDAYNILFVSDEVQTDTNTGVQYGGYGVNAIPFVISEEPIVDIQILDYDDDSDVDIVNETYTRFVVDLSIFPQNWTRTTQDLNIISSCPSVIGVSTSGGKEITRSFGSSENTKINLYALSAGRSEITVQSNSDPTVSAECGITVHIPSVSVDTACPQVHAGVRKTVYFPGYANTSNGQQTTDKILGIKMTTNNVSVSDADISEDGRSISFVCPPIPGDVPGEIRHERIQCTIGDIYDNIPRDRGYTFDISIEVIPAEHAISIDPIGSLSMLSFDSITQLYYNLHPIMIALNGLSYENEVERWSLVDYIPYEVSVAGHYKLTFSDLISEINHLEEDIMHILQPVADYLRDKGDSYFDQHSNELEIRNAISSLYPDYPTISLNDMDVNGYASFMETRVGNEENNTSRHDFIKSRIDWCNKMIEVLDI